MDSLRIHKEPGTNFATMVVAFSGWPDAIESATMAVNRLIDKLPATKFAEIDPEEFYDFTLVRPLTLTDESDQRILRWITNEFHYFSPLNGDPGLILFKGTEPNLRWRTYTNNLMKVVESCGVSSVIHLGALLDEVPHTREPKVTGRASTNELTHKIEWLGIPNSKYKGSTGIQSVFMEACRQQGIDFTSIWGHSPHYVTTGVNPRVTHLLLKRFANLANVTISNEELSIAGNAYEDRITQAMLKRPDMMAYVRQLEKQYDDALPEPTDIPPSDEMVAEIQEFFNSQP